MQSNHFFYKIIISISTLAFFFAIVMYMKLGSYTYYLADDYCEAVRVNSSNPIQAVIERYSDGAWRAANRYSNITFVGFSEMLGENSIPITIVLMMSLWLIGLCWSIYETRTLFNIKWHSSLDLFFGGLLTFFSFLLAPSLFQTVYWRSSMMTHFAPLAFISLLFAFVIKQVRNPQPPSKLIYFLILCSAFVIAGFSEPPTTTLLTALSLLIFSIWRWDNSVNKSRHLALVGFFFIGILLGFFLMLFSPAITDVANEKSQSMIQVLFNSFYYAFLFIEDSLKTVPLPLLLSFVIPFLLIFSFKQNIEINTKHLLKIILIAPIIMWLLIAAGFSPSVFGQGFPVERMRFLARVLVIITLMLEGISLALLLPKQNQKIIQTISFTLFAIISIIYPIRTAINIIAYDLPEYSERARLWNLRVEYIHRRVTEGQTDLVIPGFSGIYGIKEVDDNPNHWINTCVAEFYNVNSVRTIGVDNLEEFLNE